MRLMKEKFHISVVSFIQRITKNPTEDEQSLDFLSNYHFSKVPKICVISDSDFIQCFENGLCICILRIFQSRKTTGIKIGNAICHCTSQSSFGYYCQCNLTKVIDFKDQQSLSLAF